MFEREQVVARLDSRPAVADDMLRRDAADERGQLRAEILGRSECAPLIDVLLEKIIRRAGNMSGYRIHRFDLAAIPLGRPRIHKTPLSIAGARSDFVDADDHVHARRRLKFNCLAPGRSS